MQLQLLLQAVGIVVVLSLAGLGAYFRVVSRINDYNLSMTNRLTAIETKLANGLLTQVQHLMSEGDINASRIAECTTRLERLALDMENHKADHHASRRPDQ